MYMLTDNGLNIQDYFDEVLDEANNRNTTHKSARGGKGENINRKNSSNSGKGKTATTIGSHGKGKLSKKERKKLGITKNNPQGVQKPKDPEPEEPKKEEPEPEVTQDPPPKEEPKQEEPKKEEPEPEEMTSDVEQEQESPNDDPTEEEITSGVAPVSDDTSNDQEQDPQNTEAPTQDEPKTEKPNKEEPKEEEDKQGKTDDGFGDADIDDETRQEAASEIVINRVNFFNNQLAEIYRAVGNLMARKQMVFPIFTAKLAEEAQVQTEKEGDDKNTETSVSKNTDGSTGNGTSDAAQSSQGTENASFEMKFKNYLMNEVSLFETEEKGKQEANNTEQNKQQPRKCNLVVSFAKGGKSKFFNALVKLGQNLGVEMSGHSNLGVLCVVTGALINKYRELNTNITKVNEYIKIDQIDLDGESINMNINNKLLKELNQVFSGTPGEKALRILNAFCMKNIGSITSNTKLDSLIEALPNEVNEKIANEFKEGNEFKISFNVAKEDRFYRLLTEGNVLKAWFNIDNDKENVMKALDLSNNAKPENKPEEAKAGDNKENKQISNSEQKQSGNTEKTTDGDGSNEESNAQ